MRREMCGIRSGLATLAAVLVLSFVTLPRPGSGQEPRPQRGFREQVSVDYVLVPVVVKGPKGTVDNLEPGAFTLFVDGSEVAIASFESGDDMPFTLFLLQDLSGSMELLGKLRSSRRILRYFLDRAHPGDQFSLLTFSGRRVDQSVPLTSEISLLRRASRSWKPYGTTALHDAIAYLPSLIVDRPNTRRAVLLVSDGLDNASSIRPSEARDRIRTSEVPVYVIGLETGSPYELTAEGKKRHRYADVMNLLAHLTGGRYHSVFELSDLEAACTSILQDLRHQYILGFSAGGHGESAPRNIEVRVKRKNVDVSYRQVYEGKPPLKHAVTQSALHGRRQK